VRRVRRGYPRGGGEAGVHAYRCCSMAHFMRRGVPLDDFIERVIAARLAVIDAKLKAGVNIDVLADVVGELMWTPRGAGCHSSTSGPSSRR
jgi:hypothetical protein